MIRMMRSGSRKLRWLIPFTRKSKKRSRTKSKLDTDEMHTTELVSIDEDSEMYEQQYGRSEKHAKREKTGKKMEKEELGRVFSGSYSMKHSYALFLNRMTSTRSFGGLQTY